MIMKAKISFDKNSHFFAYGSIQRTNKNIYLVAIVEAIAASGIQAYSISTV